MSRRVQLAHGVTNAAFPPVLILSLLGHWQAAFWIAGVATVIALLLAGIRWERIFGG